MATVNFNDSIYAQAALEAFVANAPWLGLFSHSYNSDTEQKGNVVYVPLVGTATTTTFSYASNGGYPYEQDGGTISTVTVNLDQNFICPSKFNDQQVANSSAATFVNLADQQGKSLAKAMWQRIATLFTTANFGLAVQNISINNYGYTAGASIRTIMAKRDVPVDKLSIIANEDLNFRLLMDAVVYSDYSFGGDVARQGRVGRVAGLPVYETNIMPANGISLVGIVAHPDSVAIAMRYLEPQVPGTYAEARRVVDPESGITLGLRRHYNPAQGTHYLNLEALWGMNVGLSLGLGLLTQT